MAAARDRTIALLITLLMVVSAGCSRGEGPSTPAAQLGTPAAEESTPEATEAQPTEPSEPADPYAIPADPDDIDEQYVEKVLEALNASVAKAARILVREGSLTPEARRSLASAHEGPALTAIVEAFEESLKRGKPTDFFSANARPIDVDVKNVITATRSCIWTLVFVNNDSLGGPPVEPFPTYYYLEAKGSSDGPARDNPTPWVIKGDGPPLPGDKKYADPCE